MDSERTLVSLVLMLGLVTHSWPGAAHAGAAPRDIVLMLDNSGSMVKNDPDFLTSLAVRTFLEDLAGDVHVAIVIFDQNVSVPVALSPLDEQSRPDFLRSLDRIDFKGKLTDSPAALERAIYELRNNGRPSAEKSIVFLTDGIVDTGDASRDLDKSQWMQDELAGDAAEAGIRIFGVAFTENADFQLIQSLAHETSGEYYRAFAAEDIAEVFASIRAALEQRKSIAMEPEPLGESSPLEGALPELPESSVEPLPELPSDVEPKTSATTGDVDPSLPPTLAQAPASKPSAGGEETGASPSESQDFAVPEIATARDAPESGLPATGWMVIGLALLAGAVTVTVVVLRSRRSASPRPTRPYVPQAFLNDLSGVSGAKSYELGERITVVGRLPGQEHDAANFIVIDENTLGRRHAIIEFKNHAYHVSDQNSMNGTFVNAERIKGERQLKHGDRVRFYKYEFELVIPEMFGTGMTLFSQTVFSKGRGRAKEVDVTEARPARPDDAAEAHPPASRPPRPDDATEMNPPSDPRADSDSEETLR